MGAYQKFLFRFKWVILLLFSGITVFFAFSLKNISVESRTRMWFKKDDPFYMSYERFKREFGNDHILIIGMSFQKPISKEVEEEILEITTQIKKIEGVLSVISIIDVKNYSDVFLSKDKRATQIIVYVTEEGSQFLRGDIVKEVRRIIGESDMSDKNVHLSGSIYMGTELDRYARKNLSKTILLTLVGMSLILFFTLRKFSLTAIVLFTSLVAVVWAMGFYVMMGNAVNLVTNMITPLVLIISISVGIHIINRVQEELPNAESKKEAIISGMSAIWIPCFLASATTAVGFFSLFFSPSNAIAKFGLYAALAMILECIVFFHIFPLFLFLVPNLKSPKETNSKSFMTRVLSWNSRFVSSEKQWIIWIFSISIVVFLFGFLRIDVNTNQLKYFSTKSDLVKSAKFFDEHFGGIYFVQAIMVADKAYAFQKQENLQKILDLQNLAVERYPLKREISLGDIMSSLSSTLGGRNLTSLSYLLKSERAGFLKRLVSDDFKKTVVTFRTSSDMSSKEMSDILSSLQELADRIFEKEKFSVEFTGIIPLYAHFYEHIVKTQVISFSIAFLLIILIIGLTFRSVLLTLLVAFSNVLSIIMIFGLMGFLGINLDAGTVMIASIAIGIIVDDTIHVLFRIGREQSKDKQDSKKSIDMAIKQIGRAVIITSLVNGLGFLMLIFSDFKPARFFGILMALTMLSALLADLVLLPHLIIRSRLRIKTIGVSER